MTFLAAFGGGVFGALIGAIPAFIFTGLIGLIGIAVLMATGDGVIINNLAFGPFFGPHIAFAGAVASAAYAARKGSLESGMDILKALNGLNDPMVLIVGGIFGVLGHGLNLLFTSSGFNMDTVALTVVLSGMIARIIFGRKGLINNTIKTEKFSFNPTMIIGAFGLSCVVSYMVDLTQVNILGFCICATLLMFAQVGFDVPATHHIGLVTGYATLASGNLYIGIACGVIAEIVLQVFNHVFNTSVDTHIDPPAAAIAMCSLVIFAVM